LRETGLKSPKDVSDNGTNGYEKSTPGVLGNTADRAGRKPGFFT